jgi:hypothetical protein
MDFILELSDFCSKESFPILMGGDFNLIRSNKDRNKGQGDPKLMDIFNNFIGCFHLREIFVSRVKFTWSNKQKNPTLVKLDRILATTSWDSNYHHSFAWSKAGIGSDHSPLIIDTGEEGASKSKYFFFEEKWIHQEGFSDLIKSKWGEFKSIHRDSAYSPDIWHGCLQALRHYLRGWSLRISEDNKKMRKNYTDRIEEIDIIAESRLLSNDEWEERIGLEKGLDKMSIIEELQWKQKVSNNWILHGDANTQFFHQFVNGRRRKKTIIFLENGSEEFRGQNAISAHIVDFYKELFGHNEPCSMFLNPEFWPEEIKVSHLEGAELIRHFSMEEIRQVVMDMKENSANGYGVVFFKKFWDQIKDEMKLMFSDFFEGKLDIKRLNYGVITLVPKNKEANNVKQFRPICLLNVYFKCFTKARTNRLVPVARKILARENLAVGRVVPSPTGAHQR